MEDSQTNVHEMHAIVKGRVQGVGFRATTCYHASSLGLKGTVKNLSDGSVEIYAQGSRAVLDKLVLKLKNEMRVGLIQDFLVEYYPVKKEFSDFRII